MKILVTGAKGFVGKNLCAQLNNIKEGKARWYEGVQIDEVFEYDLGNTQEELNQWCSEADFVFNLAGVNRPQAQEEFMQGNFGFASTLLDTMKAYQNACPVMLSSSAQASLTGRFGNSEYGRSKKAGEDLFFAYGQEVGAKILIYRFPNLFGKWCRPHYNSAIATFCSNIANDLPIQVYDRSVEMELLYIDDLVDEMIAALTGKEHRCEFEGLETLPKEDGRYCYCPITHQTTLGEIVDILNECAVSVNPAEGNVQTAMSVPQGSLAYKLMTTYLSYLPQHKAVIDLNMNVDQRGSFTELIHTLNNGQVSINISKPGITKGEHWHHSKWETFIVVAGYGLIQLRKEGTDEIWNYEVSGEKIQAVHMLPGYTHNIINLSETEDLVTVMYCNEIFNPNHADTYFDPVKRNKEMDNKLPKFDYSDVKWQENGKLKLTIVVGTRPEIIRLAAVINKCRKYFDVILAHTGQNYDYNLNGVFFKDLKLKDPEVYMDAVGDDLGATCGNIINCSYKLFNQTKPDAVLVLGDTNSCLSVIGAKRLHIPIFHMEAGNRCKDECLPEETNRRIVDIISDVNMAYSEHARRYLAECGLPRERTYVTGSPMAEVLHENLKEIELSDIHQRLGLEKGKYILLSAHREENIDTEKNFISLFTAINKMAEKYDMPILYSCHPRSRNRLATSEFKLDSRVQVQQPMGFHDYNSLQMSAFCVVSDSGTLPEESSFYASIGKPISAVCIRTSTERPEALDKACFVLSGIDAKGLLQSVDLAIQMTADGNHGVPVPNYTDDVSNKVVKIIQSYVGVVNKMVWRKEK